MFKAMDTNSPDGQLVAVKLIPRATADDTHRVFFRREVEALGRLSHPNIVSLLDQGEDEREDAFYLVFAWIERGLRDVLPPAEELGWDDFAEQWGLPLVDALAYAHERDVVHRDVKPTNILVGQDDTPLLADFGISKIRTSMVSEATVADFVSRPFAPPDLAGMARASRDVWGFAATALCCLTSGPFDDYPHLYAALDEVDTPPEVRELLGRCVNRDPETRPRDAIVLRGMLRDIQQRRTRNWLKPQTAQLVVRDEAARGLVPLRDARDLDAIERALQAEFTQGSHLARVLDPNTGSRMADTLDLVGHQRRLRLVVLPDQPGFVVSKVFRGSHSELESVRRGGWPVPGELSWTSRPQKTDEARKARERALAGLDEHYLRQDELQQARDENRPFDAWTNLLDAKKEMERTRSAPLVYTSFSAEGKRIRFRLQDTPDSDIIGEERVCRPYAPGYRRVDVVGAPGSVVDQDEHSVTLAYQYKPKNLPDSGELVLDTGASDAALQRQREAVVSVRSENSARPQLRRMLLDPGRITTPVPWQVPDWFDDRLDDDKRTAVAAALGCHDFHLLEGPPGTGKTSFITELVRQELRRNPDARILLVSQTHVAVDNALVRLVEAGLDNVVRLGRPGDARIAEQVHPHLLDQRMPTWVRQIRERAELHLEQMAATAEVDLTHARGAAALRELLAVLTERQGMRDRLAWIAGPGRPSFPVAGHVEADDGDGEVSEAGRLNESLERLGERVGELRERASTLLGSDLARSLLADIDPDSDTVRAAFDAVVEQTPGLRKLVGVLELQSEWLQRIESSRDLEAILLRQANVVAGTCLGFLSHPAVRELAFDLCILDEASKATATETLVPLVPSRRWVLVGDPNQLPPMQEEVLDHPEIMERYDLERAAVERSLFRDLLDDAPNGARHRLTHQYRMHPGIGDLISECFYEGTLRSVARPELPGWNSLHTPVAWLDTSNSDRRHEKRIGTSLANQHEAQVVKRELDRLRRALEIGSVRTEDGSPLQVLVLTAYRQQMEQLRRVVAGPASALLQIEVNTVDAVQGREADVTFYSVVRSNDRRELGFLGPSYWRRVNVALSRSRHGLVIVGDASFCESMPGPLQDVLTHIRNHTSTCRIGAARA